MGIKRSEAIFVFLFVLRLFVHCESVPLSTSSRWIVDRSTGKRVKLACANWASHLQPMIAEGLEKKPINVIARKLSANGFNCVRFTWATFMFTRPSYYNLKVSESLDMYNLTAAKSGIAKNNPRILDMKIWELHVAVVNELGRNNLMVVLDNHVSKPNWCCESDDGNGFFGDTDFDPDEWVLGLAAVARMYKGNPAVVGMSLRNELRGRRQNEADWYKYMQQGANAVHNENPDLLVIISGLEFDTNLSFLKRKPLDLNLNLNNKLVYEAHWYTFGISTRKWTAQTNELCARMTRIARGSYMFLTRGSTPFPLILSEFGFNQGGGDEGQNRHMTCLLAEVAGRDMDWALWAFQGSYMLRHGVTNMEESFGVMNRNWNGPRNRDFIHRLQIIRQLNQEPTSSRRTYYKMFHPHSGLCVVISNNHNAILANCKFARRWKQHKEGRPLQLEGSARCLAVRGEGAAIGVSHDCSSKWKYVSSSGLHLAAQDGRGNYLCLEKNAYNNSTLVTNKCLCVGDDLVDLPACADNPQVQWFKLVPANV